MKNIEAVGKIVWLMGQSKTHQAHDIADIHRVVLPPGGITAVQAVGA
jgi:hemolysin-activating ACP:hemolysin acyltransferase